MYHRFVKRAIDLLISVISIILFSPLLLIVSLILKCSDEGDVLYIQRRVGLDNQLFNVYKFITMRRGSEQIKNPDLSNDSRVFPFGRLLRAAKINELPQLFNVLLGDMSVVGPRPLIFENFNDYPQEVKTKIYNLNKPGLTGMGSLFFRNEERILIKLGKNIDTAFKEDILPVKGDLELWYRRNKGLWLDIKIALCTALAIFVHRPFFISWFPGIPDDLIQRYRDLASESPTIPSEACSADTDDELPVRTEPQ